MSDPREQAERRTVRVRRSPKVGVFLAVGAVVGALAAVVVVNVTPPDATVPKVQAIGFLILLLAPVGALAAGAIALVVDRRAERRAREFQADRLRPVGAPPELAVPDAVPLDSPAAVLPEGERD